jgi:signal transduction histidine kinase
MHSYEIFLRPRLGTDGKLAGLSTAAIDITQRKAIEEELRQHRDHLERLVRERTRELRDLSHRLISAQENERNLIGNELHDQIGQHLTYTTLLLDQLAHKQGSPELSAARAAVQDAIGKIRNLSSLLSPRLLRSSGLLVALDSLIEEYIRNTHIPVGFHHEAALEALPKELALACFRVIQESLTNVARHAKAGRVEVRLSSPGDRLHLEISDDGIGFDIAKTDHSTGLTGMRERALALGGELVIRSTPGQGTLVTADFLLERNGDQ